MKRTTRRAILFAFLSGLAVVAGATSPEEAEPIAQLANVGNDGAQLMIALFYLKGSAGYRRSLRLALRWARRAAAAGNAYARLLVEELQARMARARGA